MIEDYQRRVQTITEEIEKITETTFNDKVKRLQTKKGCYNTIITELNRLLEA